MKLLHKDEKKIKRLSAFMEKLLSGEIREEKREVYKTYKDAVQAIRPIDLYYGRHVQGRFSSFKRNNQKDGQQICEHLQGRALEACGQNP
ncbi:MAG: hypothetical protein ACOC2X_01625 [Bacillota bacterium]